MGNPTPAQGTQASADPDVLEPGSKGPEADATPPASACEDALQALMAFQGADLGALVWAERARPLVVASRGLSPEYLDFLGDHGRLDGVCGKALEIGQIVAVEDIESDPRFAAERHEARLGGFRAFLGIPLFGGLGWSAAAMLYFRDVRPFTEPELRILELHAAHAALSIENALLRVRIETERSRSDDAIRLLEARVQKAGDRRRALMHIISDINQFNKRLADQRKAMLHILGDYEKDRSRLEGQTERLDNSRRALLSILKDSHRSNLRLADSRKAMIHIMGDLRETTNEIRQRERELRDKQEQLVQAGKLATLGELTTGVAHELNNPLNNIGLYVGNVIDIIELGRMEKSRMLSELGNAMLQVRKATEIISHLRTFGRAAAVTQERVSINQVMQRALALMHEQLRLREIDVTLNLSGTEPCVMGNPIQLEQVMINLLTNARDAMVHSEVKRLHLASAVREDWVEMTVQDTGTGIPKGLEQRIFDPFFTTKEVGSGTGLGLSITYSIIREHEGSIQAEGIPGRGARFSIRLPLNRGKTADSVPGGPP